MRVLVIEHESDSGIGLLGERAVATGAELEVVTPMGGIPVSAEGYDAVVTMGASPSVNDADIAPWFDRETALLRDADRRGIPVLGVCFGAQALAVALGGSVSRAVQPEVGWKMVDTEAPGVIAEGPWFQWHVDAITPPPQATVLATSDVSVQAYTVGPHLAVQFHPEVTAQQARDWSTGDPAGLAASGCTLQELVALTTDLEPDARRRAADLWDTFVIGATERGRGIAVL